MTDKDIFIKKMHAKIDEWNAQIDRLAAKSEIAGADAKAEYNNSIDKLQRKRDEIDKKIREAVTAGDNAWQDMKIGITSAVDALETSLASARSRFK